MYDFKNNIERVIHIVDHWIDIEKVFRKCLTDIYLKLTDFKIIRYSRMHFGLF